MAAGAFPHEPERAGLSDDKRAFGLEDGREGNTPPGPSPFTAAFETGRHYQVHKSYIYVAPITAVFVVAFVVLLNGMQGWVQLALAIQDGEISVNPLLLVGAAVLGMLAIMGLLVGLYALGWRNMSYVFDEGEFSFYSGIITKRRVHVPYARVQSVNHRASIIQRVVGVCTVIIDSAGGSSNKGVRVPYVTLETAERLRDELFMRKAAIAVGMEPAPADGASVPAGFAPNALDAAVGSLGGWRGVYGGEALFGGEPVSYEYGLTNKELLLTGVSHDKPIIVALIVFLTFVVTFAFALLAQDEVSLAISRIVFPIIVALSVFTWACGLAAVLVSYGGFRARRRGSRIEVERGLLSRDFSGIDIERVQSVEVRQSFVRRIIGYCELSLGRIDTASEQNKGNSNSKMDTKGLVIHPFVRIDRVDEIIDGLAPEFADRPRRVDCQPLPKVAMRRAILRRCLWCNWVLWVAVAVGICWAAIAAFVQSGNVQFANADSSAQYGGFMTGSLIVVVAMAAAFTVGHAIGAVLWARHSGFTWNRHYLFLHNDGLSTGLSIIPRQKIQSAAARSNPLQRRLSLATLKAVTAAGTRSSTARLVDVPVEAASEYLDWLKPRA